MDQELACVGPGRRAQPLSTGERRRRRAQPLPRAAPGLHGAMASCPRSPKRKAKRTANETTITATTHKKSRWIGHLNHQENQFPQAIGAMQRMQETRCNKAMTAVPPTMWMVCRMESTILYVVELSSPVDISSMKRARPGVTIISAATPISGSGYCLGGLLMMNSAFAEPYVWSTNQASLLFIKMSKRSRVTNSNQRT
uniref:Uncharacterized protein n=2 Tax=Oryza barthii TaxID=65489 RepID=A0A0D3H5F1_9ORYZ